jgi:hypothetical protein
MFEDNRNCSFTKLESTLFVSPHQWERPGLNTPHARTMVKTLKLAVYLFLEF